MNKTDVNAVAELFSMCEPIQPIDYIEKNNELYDNIGVFTKNYLIFERFWRR